MTGYTARHRQAPHPTGAKRAAVVVGFGALATTAVAGTSAAAAWACPSQHAHSGTSGSSVTTHDQRRTSAGAQPGGTSGATRGSAPSNPDGASNGGADKPWGAAAANDNVDGNNGSGNDADCEDDNNGVGTPGHCRTGFAGHQHDVGGSAHGSGESQAATAHARVAERMLLHSSGGTRDVVAGLGVVHVTSSEATPGTLTVVVTRPNGDTATVTVAAPASGETVVAPVTINGVTVLVTVTGTSGGADVAVSATPHGLSSDSHESGSVGGSDEAGSVSRPAGTGASGASGASTQVLGEQVSRALNAAALTSSASSPASLASGASAASLASSASLASGTTSGAASVSPTSTQLPFTGGRDTPLLTLIGAAGVVTGIGLVRAARRRPGTRAAHTTS
ncbi:MAG TPA: hypothetical protein VFH66_14675 [Mycobacteriales bacterium]|nr:hypothetical protein [Mycobacteriales bacterium]